MGFQLASLATALKLSILLTGLLVLCCCFCYGGFGDEEVAICKLTLQANPQKPQTPKTT